MSQNEQRGRRAFLKMGVYSLGAGALGGLLPGLGSRAMAAGTGEALIEAAKREGRLNVIALPPNWANYGEIIPAFHHKYGLRVTSASPNASSAEELQAVRTLKGQSRAPDVVDVGPSFALIGQKEGLFAPYKVPTWDSIPEGMKDPEGHWYGDYFGVISFGVNTSVVKHIPRDWADLKRPEYKGQIALNGNPLRAGAAFGAVWAAALGNGGSLDDITPGVEYFADLAKRGNYIPIAARPATLESGQTPITVDWDYLNLAYRKQFKGRVAIDVRIPETGVFGNYYCQAISRHAPNPSAARLWEDFIYSDAGQLLYLKGYAHPARFNDMVARGVIPESLMAELPPSEPYKNVRFPNAEQTKKAQDTVGKLWQKLVRT
ncbi:iron ABC transporter substrate-binding protein [Acidihalobacter yilgarnensis]|uniref:Iron ABC transporter substrate-binding protein n=1 Tax=Acidihalobacter yilgarnensis TaxID=2819280 RepID=A0A1D8IRV8_9GAMM|nr:ABC transporter substrate-binding protein [Acidihalobacter yilgarnensis]AOU99232.1 iron ABC transporter substrate-binding protein [Acidihalobacter yilgarnensis]